MVYSEEFKQKVLASIIDGMSFSEAAEKYHVARTSIYDWRQETLRGKKRNRLAPIKKHDIIEKVGFIRQLESGAKSIGEIALENDLRKDTVRRWFRDRKHIYAVYYALEDASEKARDSPDQERPYMDPENKKRDENLNNRTLKEENRYLKAKVMYLEKLMELNGTPAPRFKKKRDTKPSESSAKTKE